MCHLALVLIELKKHTLYTHTHAYKFKYDAGRLSITAEMIYWKFIYVPGKSTTNKHIPPLVEIVK